MHLASINIEGDKHLDRVLPFLKNENPDVLCFQEIPEKCIPILEKEFALKSLFLAMNGEKSRGGIAVFTKHKIKSSESFYYYRSEENDGRAINIDRVVLITKIKINEDVFNIATTHFTHTKDGKTDEYQRKDIEKMISFLKDKYPSLVLCGDMNIPRGEEAYFTLTKNYKDNIPEKYDSSIDPKLHIKKGLKLMVDHLLTTPKYKARNVSLVSGVSDHKAIVADIYKA